MWRSQEEQAWLDMPPIGAEFGSPDNAAIEPHLLDEIRTSIAEVKDGKVGPYVLGFKDDGFCFDPDE